MAWCQLNGPDWCRIHSPGQAVFVLVIAAGLFVLLVVFGKGGR
jgi:hypothetical protein